MDTSPTTTQTHNVTPSTVLPDSGARSQFSTGAVRDAAAGKGFPHMIPPIAIRKMACRFEDGATKYGPMNWMKGIPLSRFIDGIKRHTDQAAENNLEEDHIGAVLWNAAAYAWTLDQIQKGNLPESLNDLPFFCNPEDGVRPETCCKAISGDLPDETEVIHWSSWQ